MGSRGTSAGTDANHREIPRRGRTGPEDPVPGNMVSTAIDGAAVFTTANGNFENL
jgi:hypothetical protein